MKSLRELREFKLRVQHRNLTAKSFHKFDKIGLIDWEVYLPTIKYNLQRESVWTFHQKEQLIWSVLIGRDIQKVSVISMYVKGDEFLQIIDGKQRLKALIDFIDNVYRIHDENGKSYYYKDLPREYQLAISYFQLGVNTVYQDIDKPIPDEDKIEWFNRINFAGTPQDLTHQLKLKGFVG